MMPLTSIRNCTVKGKCDGLAQRHWVGLGSKSEIDSLGVLSLQNNMWTPRGGASVVLWVTYTCDIAQLRKTTLQQTCGFSPWLVKLAVVSSEKASFIA